MTVEHIVYSHPNIVKRLCVVFNLFLKHSYVPERVGEAIAIPLVKDSNADV